MAFLAVLISLCLLVLLAIYLAGIAKRKRQQAWIARRRAMRVNEEYQRLISGISTWNYSKKSQDTPSNSDQETTP